MFNTIGRHQDDEATARTLVSSASVLTLLLTGVCAAGGAAMLTYKTAVEAPPIDDVIELVSADPVEEAKALAAFKPAPPPPARGESEPETKPVEEPEPNPDTLTPEPVAKTPVERTRTQGTADGMDGGDPTSKQGEIGGQCVGDDCGEDIGTGEGCTGDDCVHDFHHTEVAVKSRVLPRYPREAMMLGLHEASCKATVVIDDRGDPESVEIRGCPAPFHESARKALMRWKWKSAEVDGKPVRGRFTVNIQYRLDR